MRHGTVQEALGYRDVRTTMIDTHVLARGPEPHGRTGVLNRLPLAHYAVRQGSTSPAGVGRLEGEGAV